ncbi:MAG: L-lactate permease [Acidimicrobiales bacterium]|nr:L-lactate permease [Acidimicrobiales bacterium]MCB9394937.1 L-lactate permease [Acidimicrobiaceae bacterium]
MNGSPSDVPVDLVHWGLAIVPIAVLLVLLAVLRWKAPEAGPIGLVVAAGVALFAFRTPLETLAVASGKGVWDAFFILLVIWPALVLYRVTDGAGAFDALRTGITRFSRDDVFLVLAFGWVFASFLQGIAGFGTPIAVVAPLLVAIGVKPVMAVVIPLIGHAWANMFGTLGVSWLATGQVIEIEDETATAFQTAALLWIPNLTGGLFLLWLIGRGRALRHGLPMVLVISLVQGGGQLVLTLWNPVLSNFIAATVAMAAVFALSKWSRYSEPNDVGGSVMVGDRARDDGAGEDTDRAEPVMSLPMALFPYGVLTVVSIIGLAIGPVETFLERAEVGLAMPATDTGYDVTNDAESSYSPLTPFTHPGFFLVISSIAAFVVYRAKGYTARWRERADVAPLWGAVAKDALPASVAVVAFLVLSSIMGHSGQTDTLALGLSEVAPAGVYAVASTWIGVIGAFMTSSNTASNVLFSPLQDTVAQSEGLSQPAIIGSQSVGGAIGNAIAPANIVLGTGTAGINGEEGSVLRRTLPWTVVVTLIAGAATLALDVWA